MSESKPVVFFAHKETLTITDKQVFFDADGARCGETPNLVCHCSSVDLFNLVAAAPKMLEVLEKIQRCIRTKGFAEIQYGSLAFADICAAIEQAKGGGK